MAEGLILEFEGIGRGEYNAVNGWGSTLAKAA